MCENYYCPDCGSDIKDYFEIKDIGKQIAALKDENEKLKEANIHQYHIMKKLGWVPDND